MFELVGTSQFGSNADTSLSANQHYSDRQKICYEPSPYSAFLAFVHSTWYRTEPSSFVNWIAALSFHPEKLTSAGHQLFQTIQSELRHRPEDLDTRRVRWINLYPRSWHWLLSQYFSTTWKLVDSMLESSLSSRSSETIPDLGTWLAAVTWTACIHDQLLKVGERVVRLNTQMEYKIKKLQDDSTLLPLLHPPNTGAVENFRRKIKNSSHTCWDGHDLGWYASAVSYLNDDNDPEFVPGPRHPWSPCKACGLVDHAYKFAKALSDSSQPNDHLSEGLARMVSKSQCQWLDDRHWNRKIRFKHLNIHA